MAIFGQLDTERASDTLEALEPKFQRDLVASLEKEKVASLMNEMTPAQAADLLAVLPWWDVQALMQLSKTGRGRPRSQPSWTRKRRRRSTSPPRVS